MRRRAPRPRLSCPACGGAPQLPRDLRQEVRCGCGARLRVALVPARAVAKPARVPSLPEPPGQSSVAAQLDKVTLARPVPVFRDVGSERERQWGAATDTPEAPGDRLLIVAKNGSTWNGTVAAIVGTAESGQLVTLAGGRWQLDAERTPLPAGRATG